MLRYRFFLHLRYLLVIICAANSNITAQFTGSYTIGPGGSYANFTEAVSQLESAGVSNKVIFNVKAGTYNEHIQIDSIPGADSINTITFQSETGNSRDAVLSYNASTDDNNYVIKLNGAGFISFQNLTLKAEGNNYNRIIVLDNNAHDIVINGNKLEDTLTTSGSNKLAEIYIANTTFNNLKITNNDFSGGAFAIYTMGNFANVSSGVNITGNSFASINKMTMRIEYVLDLKVNNNTMEGDPGYHFYLNKCDGSLEITDNKMIGGTTGIYLSSSTGADSPGKSRGLIANNFINQTHNAGGGISLNNAENLNIYFNSINVTSTATNDACLSTYNGSSINIEDNIFTNSGGGYAINIGTVGAVDNSDYNDLYTTGSVLAVWDGDRTDLSALQTANGKETNSLSIDPGFFSDSDLHINSSDLDGKAVPLAEVSMDIDGDMRDVSTPDIGADEYTYVSNVPPSITSVPDTVAYVGSEYSYTVTASDVDGDNLTYTLTTGPSWLTIGTASGELKGIPQQSDLGINPVVITVEDGRRGTDTQSFNINVKKITGASVPIDSLIYFRINYDNNSILEKHKQTYNNHFIDDYYTNLLDEIWDSTSALWKNYGQIIQTFDSQNNLVERIEQSWNEGSWESYDKFDYSYDSDNRLKSWQFYNWIFGDWGKGAKQTYNYDSQGNLILQEAINSGSNEWRDSLIYDSNNNLSIYLSKNWVNNKWTNDWKESYTYDSNNNLVLVLEEHWDSTSNTWKNFLRSKLTYNSDNNVTHKEVDRWNLSGQWELNQRTIYEYDLNQHLTHAKNEMLDNGAWELRNGYFKLPGDTPDYKNSYPFKNRGYGDVAELFIHYNGITVVKEKKSLVKDFVLKQNYPNPFNPTTKIDYNLPEKTHVILKVYNILGEEVATLVNSIKQPGNYEITFDAGSLPSGVYIYSLSHGQNIQSKKMILLK